jgi:hypothetical protein
VGRRDTALRERAVRRGTDRLDAIGDMQTAAHVRLRAAEALAAAGRRADTDAELARARAFFERVRATRYLRRAEGLLAAAS